jgi:transposase
MEDNGRPNVARQVIDYLNAVDIPFMELPPKSPDLNPTEHLRDAFKKEVRSRTPPSFNHNQMVNAVIDEW